MTVASAISFIQQKYEAIRNTGTKQKFGIKKNVLIVRQCTH